MSTSPFFHWCCGECTADGDLPTFIGAPFSVQMVARAYADHDAVSQHCHFEGSLTIYANTVIRPRSEA